MIATAREKAASVRESLAPHVEAGRDVVVVEPSDLAMFRDDYENLDAAAYDLLADDSYEVMEYVYGLLEGGADADALSSPADGNRAVAYHSHCQQRTLGLEPQTVAVLERAGYDVVTSDVECCGMAGSFGYKSEYYDLSMDVGERLREQEGFGGSDRTVVASGTSCLDQLADLLQRPTRHPVELVAPQ
jgi:Fe-S oxidoreductase